MMTQAVGVGLVGAGAYGVFCLEAFAQMPEVRIVAVADIDGERAKTLAERLGAQAYTELDTMLHNSAVEVVALNTPPYLHAEQGLSVLQARRHLFCEKPLALRLEDGEQLIKAADANGVLLTVDYVMRRNPFWAAAARLHESGVLGGLRHMDLANHAAGLSLPSDHWFWDKVKSGGIWIEHGVHFFDAFAWVSGQRGEIVGAQQFSRSDGVNDRVEALAKYGEVAAHFYHGFDQSVQTEQTTVTLTFQKGYVTLREWVPTSIEILTPVNVDDLKTLLTGRVQYQTLEDGRNLIRADAPEGKSEVYRSAVQLGMRDLALTVRDRQHQLAITGAEGLESLRLAVNAENF